MWSKVEALHLEVYRHPLYRALGSPEAVRIFMSYHVCAVWDFMSLLKALQCRLTRVSVPWFPVGDPQLRMLINEIVLGEESDEAAGGLSHFEWYLQAMVEAGAGTRPIESMIDALRDGATYETALQEAPLPVEARAFMRFHLDLAANGKPHEIAAAFTVARENLIPGMFREVVAALSQENHELSGFLAYLERHIQLDGDHHGELATRLLVSLHGNDPVKEAEAVRAAYDALRQRYALWDAAQAAIEATTLVLSK